MMPSFSPARLLASLLAFLCFSLSATVQAQTVQAVIDLGSSPVGTAATKRAVTFSIATSAQYGAPLVVTQGSPNLDFTLGTGSTCTGAVSAGTCVVNVIFKPRAPGQRTGAVELTDTTGKIVATAFLYAMGTGPLAVLSPGTIQTLAGDGKSCPSTTAACGDGGPASAAEFSEHGDITVDAAGNLYIADRNLFRIRKVDAATGIITTIAGTGLECNDTCRDGGLATRTAIGFSGKVAVDGAGNVYLADQDADSIRKVDASTGLISKVASGFYIPFNGPSSVTIDALGNLYAMLADGSRIFKVAAGTSTITPFAGVSGRTGFNGDGQPATSAEISGNGLAVDAAGNVYIADTTNNRIRKVTASTGLISTVAGSGAQGYDASQNGGPATSAALYYPRGLALDAGENIYFSDTFNLVFRKVTAAGIISTVAGSGQQGLTAENGTATAIVLGYPEGAAIDNSGNVLFLESSKYRFRMVSATAAPVSFASTNVGIASTDSPQSVSVTNAGNTPLNFPTFSAISNPSISAGYSLATSSTCPQVSVGGTAAQLAAGTSCTANTIFKPVSVSPTNAGSLTLTDDSLNISGSTQSVSLSGVSTPGANQVTPTLTLGLPAAAAPGSNVTGTVTFASSSTSTPTGNIEIDVVPHGSTTPIVILVPAAQAFVAGGKSFTFTAPTVTGGASVFASYQGDTNYNLASSSSFTLTINAGTISTSTSVSAVATATLGASFPITITFRPSSTASTLPTGFITVQATNSVGSVTVLGTVTLAQASASGGYALQSTLNAFGPYTITATYNGDSLYSPSSGSIAVNVKALLNLANVFVPAAEPVGNTITGTLTTTLVPSSPTPSGNIIITAVHVSDGAATVLATIPASQTATRSSIDFTYTVPSASGLYRVTADYAGDANFVSSNFSFINFNTVAPVFTPTSLAITIPSVIANGSRFTSTIQLTATYSLATPPTGEISYNFVQPSTSTVVAPVQLGAIGPISALASGGVQRISYSTPAPDHYNVVATYPGDANYGPSSATVAVTIAANTPKLTLTGPATATTGVAASYAVALTDFGGTPNAGILVTSTANGVPGPQATVTGTSGTAVLTFNANGTYTITASFVGDAVNPAVSATFTTVVSGGPIADYTIKFDNPAISTVPVPLTGSTTADVPFVVAAINGYNGTINLSAAFEQLDQNTFSVSESNYSLLDDQGNVLSTGAGIHNVVIKPTAAGVHLRVHLRGRNATASLESSPLRAPAGIAFAGLFAGIGLLGWRKRRSISPRLALVLLAISVVASSGCLLAGCGAKNANFRVTLKAQPNGPNGTPQTASFVVNYND